MKPITKVFVLLALLSFAGCKKDKEPDPGPLYIPQEVKDYVFFQPGTYWVYIDSISGRVDSVAVYETTHGFDTLTIGKNPKRAYEIFVVKAHSFMDGWDYYFEVNTTYSANDNTLFDIFEEKLKPTDYAGRTILFLYKPIIGKDLPYINSHLKVEDIYSNYYYNNQQYHDVIKIWHDLSIVEVSNHVTNFIAKNVGLIRKEYADSNQVWILARSNIIQ